MLSPDDVRLLEAHLDGTLSPQSRAALERRLTTEPELQRALKAERELRRHLSTKDPRADLLSKLDAIMDEPVPVPPAVRWYTRPWVWLLLVALAGAIGWYLLDTPTTVSPLPPPTEIQPVIETVEEDQPTPPAPVDTTTQRIATDPPDVVPPTIRPAVPKRKVPDRTIAAAYQPNDQLEARMATQYRGGEIDVFPEVAVDLPNVTSAGVVSFKLAGQVKTAIPAAELRLEVNLLNNQYNNFTAGNYLLTRPLPVVSTPDRNTLRYELPLNVQLGPGLYYVLIRDTDTEEVLSVQRMRVE